MILEQISEGSCDTEDWSNNVENSVFAITRINYILKQKTEKNIKIVILSLFLLYLWSNKCFKYVNKKNYEKSYWPHTFERQCTIPFLTIFFLLIYSWCF